MHTVHRKVQASLCLTDSVRRPAWTRLVLGSHSDLTNLQQLGSNLLNRSRKLFQLYSQTDDRAISSKAELLWATELLGEVNHYWQGWGFCQQIVNRHLNDALNQLLRTHCRNISVTASINLNFSKGNSKQTQSWLHFPPFSLHLNHLGHHLPEVIKEKWSPPSWCVYVPALPSQPSGFPSCLLA